jgi:hypothetical protein
MTMETGDCFYCGEPTFLLGANPSRWPLKLPVDPGRPGVTKTVCAGCVLTRLRFADSHADGPKKENPMLTDREHREEP